VPRHLQLSTLSHTHARTHARARATANGRWGNSRSPAYGTLSDYQFMRRHAASEKRRGEARAAWGEAVESEGDVADVFVKYCKVCGARAGARVAVCRCGCARVWRGERVSVERQPASQPASQQAR
jgi:hypothetical protein